MFIWRLNGPPTRYPSRYSITEILILAGCAWSKFFKFASNFAQSSKNAGLARDSTVTQKRLRPSYILGHASA